MRKGRDGGKRGEKTGKKMKREKTDKNSGHYVNASSRPPERRWNIARSCQYIKKEKDTFIIVLVAMITLYLTKDTDNTRYIVFTLPINYCHLLL